MFSLVYQNEFIDSTAKSNQETALQDAIRLIIEGKESAWRERWIRKATEYVQRNPVNLEMEHWAWILRCAALVDSAFFDRYILDLWNSINSTDNLDVQ